VSQESNDQNVNEEVGREIQGLAQDIQSVFSLSRVQEANMVQLLAKMT
jgi:hypothetical protein